MLKFALLFFATVTVVVVCLPIAGRNPQAASLASALAPTQNAASAPPAKNPVRPTAESQAKAKMLYRRDCAFCHGDNGDGKNTMNVTLADWTNPSTLASKIDGDLFSTIRNGVGDKMPPEDAGRATDTDIWNLIIYIRSLSKNRPPAPVATPAAIPAAPAPAPSPAPSDAPAPAPAPPTN